MSKVDRDLVRAYQRRVSRERKDTPGGKQPHSLATRQRRLVAVRSFLRFASLEEWTTRDLAAAIDLPKLPQRLPKPLEDADRERLVHDLPATTVQEKRDRALVFLLLSTGARISEILRLDRRDWALERLTVVGKGERNASSRSPRGRATRWMTASPHEATPRRHCLLRFTPAREATRPRGGPTGSPRAVPGTSARRSQVTSGSRDLHPHRLRHTLGTLLQEQLGDARLTAETLGHAGLGSVAGYTKITAARRHAAKATIEDAGL